MEYAFPPVDLTFSSNLVESVSICWDDPFKGIFPWGTFCILTTYIILSGFPHKEKRVLAFLKAVSLHLIV
jgi:hypothetical protein